MIVFITTKMKPVAAIHSMPRTTGAGLESISTSGSIVAQDFCNNRPPMANLRVCCEIAGKVVRIEARAGSHVSAEDTLLLIECMKMEIPVAAPAAGVLEALDTLPDDFLIQLVGRTEAIETELARHARIDRSRPSSLTR